LLYELRSIANTWDDIVLLDGLKSARTLVDSRTELECVLHLSSFAVVNYEALQ